MDALSCKSCNYGFLHIYKSQPSTYILVKKLFISLPSDARLTIVPNVDLIPHRNLLDIAVDVLFNPPSFAQQLAQYTVIRVVHHILCFVQLVREYMSPRRRDYEHDDGCA